MSPASAELFYAAADLPLLTGGATHQIQMQASNATAMGYFAVVLAFLYLSLFTIGFQVSPPSPRVAVAELT